MMQLVAEMSNNHGSSMLVCDTLQTKHHPACVGTYTVVLMICFASISALLTLATLAMQHNKESQAHALTCKSS